MADWHKLIAAASVYAASHLRELEEADAPTPDEAKAFEERCQSVPLPELGDILWRARSPHYSEIAERVLAERLFTKDRTAQS